MDEEAGRLIGSAAQQATGPPSVGGESREVGGHFFIKECSCTNASEREIYEFTTTRNRLACAESSCEGTNSTGKAIARSERSLSEKEKNISMKVRAVWLFYTPLPAKQLPGQKF